MQQVLIVNLKRLGDVYSSAHLIGALKEDNPHAKISLLVYEESAPAARNLQHIENVYTINRHEIITLKVNKLFSNGLAIEHFYEALKPVKGHAWDRIINFSNDRVSALISSYLSTSSNGKKIGVSFSSDMTVKYNSDWDIILNELIATTNDSPLSYIDCLRQMCVGTKQSSGEQLKISSKHHRLAEQNIKALKERYQVDTNTSAKAIGIQLFASHSSKQMNTETLIETIKCLNADSRYIPILLIAPFDNEREFAREINRSLGNQIVVAEADLNALASVVAHLDLLITPDTVTKHVSDLVRTACLEISLADAPLFKQGSNNPKSLILSPAVHERIYDQRGHNFNHPEITNQSDVIQASDILSCIEYFFSGESNSLFPALSENVALYRIVNDELGSHPVAICGNVHKNQEINRLLVRHLLAKSMGVEMDDRHLKSAATLLGNEAPSWSESQKEVITTITKDLLGTLRALIQAQESRKKVGDFVHSLDRLLTHVDSGSIAFPFIKIFKGRMESLNSQHFAENIREVEGLLYELKADLQKALLVIKDIEGIYLEEKKRHHRRSSEIAPNHFFANP